MQDIGGALSNGALVGVDAQGKLVTQATSTSSWQAMPGNSCCVTSASVLDDGTLVGVLNLPLTNARGQLATWSTTSETWTAIPYTCCVKAAAGLPDGSLVGIDSSGTLVSASILGGAWTGVPNGCCVTSVTALPDGSLAGVDTTGNLVTRATLSSPWVSVPNSCCVSSVADLHVIPGGAPATIRLGIDYLDAAGTPWVASVAGEQFSVRQEGSSSGSTSTSTLNYVDWNGHGARATLVSTTATPVPVAATPVPAPASASQPSDLRVVAMNQTGLGTTEVHVLTSASDYGQYGIETATALGTTSPNQWAFAFGPHADLYAIKMNGTGSAHTEVHILTAASRYQQYSPKSPTPLAETSPGNWSFQVDSNGDLFAINTNHSGSGKVEVQILTAASTYQGFLQRGCDSAAHRGSDYLGGSIVNSHDDLVGIKVTGTGSDRLRYTSSQPPPTIKSTISRCQQRLAPQRGRPGSSAWGPTTTSWESSSTGPQAPLKSTVWRPARVTDSSTWRCRLPLHQVAPRVLELRRGCPRVLSERSEVVATCVGAKRARETSWHRHLSHLPTVSSNDCKALVTPFAPILDAGIAPKKACRCAIRVGGSPTHIRSKHLLEWAAACMLPTPPRSRMRRPTPINGSPIAASSAISRAWWSPCGAIRTRSCRRRTAARNSRTPWR